MSRKDYEAVANLIYKLFGNVGYEDNPFDAGYEKAVEDTAYGLAEIFALDNENFDTQRFFRACGV